MGLIRVKRSTYECDGQLFHNHGGAPLHSQGLQRRAAKVIRWTAWHFVNLMISGPSTERTVFKSRRRITRKSAMENKVV